MMEVSVKGVGFLAVSFRIGRSTTINGLGHKRRTEPWHEIDQELEKARLERRCLDPDEHNPESGYRTQLEQSLCIRAHQT